MEWSFVPITSWLIMSIMERTFVLIRSPSSCQSLINFHINHVVMFMAIMEWTVVSITSWLNRPLGSRLWRLIVKLSLSHWYQVGCLIVSIPDLCPLSNFDFVCLIWFFTSHQQSCSYVGTGVPGLNPQPLRLESSTLPLSHCAPIFLTLIIRPLMELTFVPMA